MTMRFHMLAVDDCRQVPLVVATKVRPLAS